ncbi:MAG TPA: type II toxin-antitoxin system HicB family antitoxin [Terrimicrobiaceae bacterium]|nr:type II toxin-antitoxin system HicB family antitoxin [Terrimicrobiaceae bacterium]
MKQQSALWCGTQRASNPSLAQLHRCLKAVNYSHTEHNSRAVCPARSCAQGDIMLHYVAILVRSDDEAWRAYLPDFSGCRAEGESAEAALAGAKTLAWESIKGSNSNFEISRPRSLIEIRDDPTWARDRNIDWQDAIVVAVEL